MKPHRISGWAFALATLTTAVAAAQVPDVAAAQALFGEGTKLMEQKNFAAACPKLAESQRLDPATATLLALAMCHEGQGKTASAWAEYVTATSRARQEGHGDRERVARERGAALERKLSTLTIAPSPWAAATVGLTLMMDGVIVPVAVWRTPVPVDPGEHRVEATGAGKRVFTATVAIGPDGDKRSVEIPRLEDDLAEVAPGGPTPVTRPAGSGLPPKQIAGISVGAAGLVAIGVGTYFGLHARKLNDESSSGCDGNACFPDAKQTRLDAISSGNWSTIAFVTAGVLVAGGATLFLLGRAKDGAAGLQVAAAASDAGGALFVAGRF